MQLELTYMLFITVLLSLHSIYHLTDCPSFISGDQLMMIEPHERIFNGLRSEFNEGAVLGSFLKENQGVNKFPDQLKVFSVLEDIDFTKSYNGTIFRLPLRTPEQAKTSLLSKYSHTPQEVIAFTSALIKMIIINCARFPSIELIT